MENPNTSPGRDLLAGLGELINDERAAGVVARLLFGLLDHVYLHFLPLFLFCESANPSYFRGSGSCSMINAHPELSLGFLSAFLIT